MDKLDKLGLWAWTTIIATLLAMMVAAGPVIAHEHMTVDHPTTNQPYCPTEDSCTVDYHDGHWTVREIVP